MRLRAPEGPHPAPQLHLPRHSGRSCFLYVFINFIIFKCKRERRQRQDLDLESLSTWKRLFRSRGTIILNGLTCLIPGTVTFDPQERQSTLRKDSRCSQSSRGKMQRANSVTVDGQGLQASVKKPCRNTQQQQTTQRNLQSAGAAGLLVSAPRTLNPSQTSQSTTGPISFLSGEKGPDLQEKPCKKKKTNWAAVH